MVNFGASLAFFADGVGVIGSVGEEGLLGLADEMDSRFILPLIGSISTRIYWK